MCWVSEQSIFLCKVWDIVCLLFNFQCCQNENMQPFKSKITMDLIVLDNVNTKSFSQVKSLRSYCLTREVFLQHLSTLCSKGVCSCVIASQYNTKVKIHAVISFPCVETEQRMVYNVFIPNISLFNCIEVNGDSPDMLSDLHVCLFLESTFCHFFTVSSDSGGSLNDYSIPESLIA